MENEKLIESYLVLNFLSNSIRKTHNVCEKYGVVSSEFQLAFLKIFMYSNFKDLGIKFDHNNNELHQFISEQAIELVYLIYESIGKGIIDMYSFYDEYNNFFRPNITNNPLYSDKIVKIKKLNKTLIKSVDWNIIRESRNQVLAHNIRDKNKNNEIAINSIKGYMEFSNSIYDCAKKFKVIIGIFDLIKQEFENDLFPNNAEN